MENLSVANGMDVIGSDGQKVGSVSNVGSEFFVVQKGFFFPTDYYIPAWAVERVEKKKVHLTVTRDEAQNQDPAWSQRPADYDFGPAPASESVGSTTRADATWPQADGREGDMEVDPAPFEHEQDNARTHVNEDDDIRVDVTEEELVARSRSVDRGDVRVRKDVVTEERDIAVPVTEERVQVSRVSVDRDATPSADAFQEGTIEVPVYGEEVEVEKRARVTGEVEISKTAETHTERVGDTVRREEVTVEGDVVDQAQEASTVSRNQKKKRR